MIFEGAPLTPPPDNLTTAQFLLDFHHPARPVRTQGNPWLVDDTTGKSYGFEEIRARVQALANALSVNFEIKENDVVGIFSSNHIDYPIAVWAMDRLGAVVTPANPSFSVEELIYQLSATKATFLVTQPTLCTVALQAAREVGIPQNRIIFFNDTTSASSLPPNQVFIDDLITEGYQKSLSFSELRLSPGEAKTKSAFLLFSSGTTGRPKAVAVPHYSAIANAVQMATFNRVADLTYDVPWEEKRFRPGDIATAVIPMYHIYGLIVNLYFGLFCGMTLVVMPQFNFQGMLKSIMKYRITHLFLAPTHTVLLCKHSAVKKYDLSFVRYLLAGAAPLSAELSLQLRDVLPHSEIGQVYGMTEAGATIAMYPLSQRFATPGSSGHLMPGMRAKVVKEDGTEAGYGEQGALILTGPQITLGYVDNTEATKNTFIDGWLHTGDVVAIKESGDIFIVDRYKEILKVLGFQVAPAELEGHLLDHPDVADAGVVGIPDVACGEVPLAFIVLNSSTAQTIKQNPQATDEMKQAIIKHVADVKVQYKWLAGGVEFIDELPKNPSGKLLRRVLRERAQEVVAKRKTGKSGQ